MIDCNFFFIPLYQEYFTFIRRNHMTQRKAVKCLANHILKFLIWGNSPTTF